MYEPTKYFVFCYVDNVDRVSEFDTLYHAIQYARDLAIHLEQDIRILETCKGRLYSVEYVISKDA